MAWLGEPTSSPRPFSQLLTTELQPKREEGDGYLAMRNSIGPRRVHDSTVPASGGVCFSYYDRAILQSSSYFMHAGASGDLASVAHEIERCQKFVKKSCASTGTQTEKEIETRAKDAVPDVADMLPEESCETSASASQRRPLQSYLTPPPPPPLLPPPPPPPPPRSLPPQYVASEMHHVILSLILHERTFNVIAAFCSGGYLQRFRKDLSHIGALPASAALEASGYSKFFVKTYGSEWCDPCNRVYATVLRTFVHCKPASGGTCYAYNDLFRCNDLTLGDIIEAMLAVPILRCNDPGNPLFQYVQHLDQHAMDEYSRLFEEACLISIQFHSRHNWWKSSFALSDEVLQWRRENS